MNKGARSHLWQGLVMLLILFLGFPGTASGAPGQVRLEVFPGYDGVYKGDWVPVRVKISNTGGDIEGELVARSEHTPAPVRASRLFVTEPVKLAGGTSKEVTLLLGTGLLADATIQFRTDGRVLAQKKIGGERIEDSELLVGVLSHSPSLSSHLYRWVSTNDAPRTRVQLLKAKEIPEKEVGLSGLDVLVVNGIDPGSLGSSRQKAIRRWVEKGGLLVVAGGPASDSTLGDWESILPVKVEGRTELNHLKPFRRWGKVPDLKSPLTISRARLADEGQAVISAGPHPLLARLPVGAGAVIYAAYDLTAPPLAEWPGNERLWREMLFLGEGDGRAFRLGHLALTGDASLEKALMKMPHLKLPSLSVMAALFLVYALGAGPIVFWILKRLNRREWAWWIIPSLGIVVSLGIYVYGQIIRGNDVLVHNLAYVETQASGEAHVRGISGFWSQEAGTYRLNGTSNIWLWPLPQQAHNRSGAEVSARSSITFFDVPYWTPRKISAESTASLGGDLRAVARFHDGTWRWEVKNETRLSLRDVDLILGDYVYRVGSLAPGETRTFRAEDVSQDIRDDIPALQKPEIKQRIKQKWNLSREELMRSNVTGYWVTGWTEEPVFSYKIQGHGMKEEHLSLVLGRVNIEPIKKGKTILWPRGTLPSQYVEEDHLLLSSSKDTALKDRENLVMIAYDLPSAPSEWKPLRIDIASEKRGHVEVYDWNKGRWVEATHLSDLSPDELSAFVSPFHRVVVLTDRSGKGPLLEVEGRVIR